MSSCRDCKGEIPDNKSFCRECASKRSIKLMF